VAAHSALSSDYLIGWIMSVGLGVGWAISIPDRAAASLHFHDAHGRLYLDGARAPLIRHIR